MRHFTIVFFFSTILLACYGQDNKPTTVQSDSISKPQAILTFKDTIKTIDTLLTGQIINIEFDFKNTGTADLVFTTVTTSDGGLLPPGTPKEPIKPGQEGKLIFIYNGIGKHGGQQKMGRVISNSTKSEQRLWFFTYVK